MSLVLLTCYNRDISEKAILEILVMNESTAIILFLLALGANVLADEVTGWFYTPILLEKLNIPYKQLKIISKEQFFSVVEGSMIYWITVALIICIINIFLLGAIYYATLSYFPLSIELASIAAIVKLALMIKIIYLVAKVASWK